MNKKKPNEACGINIGHDLILYKLLMNSVFFLSMQRMSGAVNLWGPEEVKKRYTDPVSLR